MHRVVSARYLALFAGLGLVASSFLACGGSDDTTPGSSGGGTGGTGGSGATGGVAGVAGEAGAGGGAGQTCGNGKLEGTEECDDSNLESGDGCDNNCIFSCHGDGDCNDGDSCTGTETCGADHQCAPGTALAEGADCGNGLVCVNGNCVTGQCGDAQKQTGEECDDGNAVKGDGCDACQFSCLSTDPSRDCSATGDECDGSNACDDAKHTCTAGTKLAEGASCQSGLGSCKAGICTLLTCGDGSLDTGEECDPPAAGSCSAQCKTIVVPVCGNGTIEAPEECDDGGKLNLDGCDSTCNYEAVMRMTSLSIQGGAAPSFCSVKKNQLGNVALTVTARNQLNAALKTGIDGGGTNVLLQLLGLDDLTGTADPSLEVGVLSSGLDSAKGTWPNDGTNPIDWWFLAEPNSVDTAGLPTGKFTNGAFTAKVLTAGPSDVDLALSISGTPALLALRDSKIRGAAAGTPNVPAPPPDALAPGVAVFQELIATQGNEGLCGNVTVDSLAKIPAPSALTTGATACGDCPGSKKYTYCGDQAPVGPDCNSLLDALVGGCKVVLCAVTAINSTQPDVPKSGGSLTPLSNQGPLNKIPDADTAGNQDAYSAFMTFSARRAHLTGKKP
jgi:cysteine-rich repeat protein